MHDAAAMAAAISTSNKEAAPLELSLSQEERARHVDADQGDR
jgi:hypothetical protein